MNIDWDMVRQADSNQTRERLVEESIAACMDSGDNIFLSDCVARGGQEGVWVLQGLERQEKDALAARQDPMLWKILCLKDQWGDTPQPGEVIQKVAPNIRAFKRKSGSEMLYTDPAERNIAKIDGSYEQKYKTVTEYEIDDKGCIECSFSDAGYFLQRWGIHPSTGRAIVPKREFSGEPKSYPGGGKRHIHNWRYREIRPEQYGDLEDRKPTPKRDE